MFGTRRSPLGTSAPLARFLKRSVQAAEAAASPAPSSSEAPRPTNNDDPVARALDALRLSHTNKGLVTTTHKQYLAARNSLVLLQLLPGVAHSEAVTTLALPIGERRDANRTSVLLATLGRTSMVCSVTMPSATWDIVQKKSRVDPRVTPIPADGQPAILDTNNSLLPLIRQVPPADRFAPGRGLAELRAHEQGIVFTNEVNEVAGPIPEALDGFTPRDLSKLTQAFAAPAPAGR